MQRAALLLIGLFTLNGLKSNIEQYGLFRKAGRQAASGQYAEAVREYRRQLDSYPSGILRREAAFNLACAEFEQKRYHQASELFAALPPGDTTLSAAAVYNRGNALAMEGFGNGKNRTLLQQALAAYRHALLADPGNNDARINYEIVSRALQPQRTPPPAPAPHGGGSAPQRGGSGSEISETMSRMLLENARQEEARQMQRHFKPLQPRQSKNDQQDW